MQLILQAQQLEHLDITLTEQVPHLIRLWVSECLLHHLTLVASSIICIREYQRIMRKNLLTLKPKVASLRQTTKKALS